MTCNFCSVVFGDDLQITFTSILGFMIDRLFMVQYSAMMVIFSLLFWHIVGHRLREDKLVVVLHH